ncbi:ROK family protein [Clostridium tarantellae]|uniref:ROK family protein n=1 Tax=Clostridium tarantellae TaxID=39493 RepID=A0A6I1MIC5_9CLOT|nr:ROK family protein [Clostridium tarantellae]MPQ42664.1 ROK family protein [Clostridium tarantellae]
MKKYICIDVGGTAIKFSVMDVNGNIIVKGERDTEAFKGGLNILEKLKEITRNYLKEFNIEGICVSTAGMVDSKEGKIVYASQLIPNYTGVEIKKELEKEFGLICEVENDVNCAGLGEVWKGAARGANSCVCLTVGTGIGGCIILDKKVLHGFSNSAGEVGYMNINGDEFQKIAATSRLVKKVAARKNIDEKNINGKLIFDLAKKGDKDCIEEINNMVNVLALGISHIVYVVNPEVVVLGGGIMAQKEYLMEIFEKAFKDKVIPRIYENTKLEFAENGNNAGMLGALFNFLQKHN